MSTFELLPAIDLRGGRVVRLQQGDFAREIVYAEDPGAIAHGFSVLGATWLHVVDLDGARTGEPRQLAAIAQLVAAAGPGVRVEVAGGLRTPVAAAAALEAGAARVAVGTAAIRDPAFASHLVECHGTDRVAVAIDVRDGLALGEGWRDGTAGVTPEDAIEALTAVGVTTFEVTAIDRDGLLGGPDLELLGRLAGRDGIRIIASGGIASVGDLEAVMEMGCAGAIVGRAIYEGRLDLADAVRTVAQGTPRPRG
jgi:phosphoribosylformimino-5-aminoimidazole carboxamide ribotide isomerase